MNVLDLCSGIGGFSLGFERAGMKTVAFCEINKFCQKVLKKHWPSIPIFEDIKNLKAGDINEPIDVICGGYPCQPFSLPGKRRGKNDDRNIWPEFDRLIRELRPKYVVCENVYGHVSMGLDEVLSDLEGQGYTTEAFIIPACAVNAEHRRDRVWIIAYTNGQRRERIAKDSHQVQTQKQFMRSVERVRIGQDLPAPKLCDGNDGIPDRLARLTALGNTIMPKIAEIIGHAVMAHNEEKI